MPISERVTPDLSTLADACLGYLAEHPEELLAFMEHTGFDPQSLRSAMGTKRLQQALIEYFAQNEAILLALCANTGTTPEQFMAIWHKLNPEY